MNRDYFVYTHENAKTHQVFYVGKGTSPIGRNGHYGKYQRMYCKQKRSKYWNNIVNKYGYTCKVVFETKAKCCHNERKHHRNFTWRFKHENN
jgi:hypothetical protein